MNKRLATSSLAALSIMLGSVVVSCNSDDDTNDYDIDTGYTPETMYSSTAITAFNLKADTKVLANLDSVFFTIDLEGQKIFNADSMPLGTDVRKLVPVIGTGGSSKIMIKYTDTEGNEKEEEYNSTSPDTISFSSPVKVTVTSLNETYSRTYTITVNVHNQKPDSLCWGDMAYSVLPAIRGAKDAVTVEKNGKVYCYSTDGTAWQRASADDPATPVDSWVRETVNFGFTPRLSTLTATDGDYYVLSDNGTLYSSTDGLAWSSTGKVWSWIYGAYESRVVGVAPDGAGYVHATCPEPQGYVASAVRADFPVGGTTRMLTFSSDWSSAPQGIIACGHIANGNLTSAVWGYDGQAWNKFANMPQDAALDGMTIFPYYTFKTNTINWTVTKQSTIFAMGGRKADGSLSREVYISRDLGVNWHEADSLMQLPEQMESFAGARALVIPTVMHARSTSGGGWESVTLRRLPAWCMLDGFYGSRAVAPITEWDCPYIYIYGGENEAGNLRDIVLRGVINRFTYKPLQ